MDIDSKEFWQSDNVKNFIQMNEEEIKLTLTPDMHRMLVSCYIRDVFIEEGMIWYEDHGVFSLLQNRRQGYIPQGNWRDEGYSKSWGIGSGNHKDLKETSIKDMRFLGSSSQIILLVGSEFILDDYQYFHSSKLGGKVWKDLPEILVVKEVEKEGRGYHVLTYCGLGLYLIKN